MIDEVTPLNSTLRAYGVMWRIFVMMLAAIVSGNAFGHMWADATTLQQLSFPLVLGFGASGCAIYLLTQVVKLLRKP